MLLLVLLLEDITTQDFGNLRYFLYLFSMEEWRKVPGFENYEINIDTKEGRCRNMKTGKILSNKPNKRDNRILWVLGEKENSIGHQAAVWIALAYPELVQNEYFEGAEIDHIDTDRLNNHPSNLRWVTRKENANNPLTKKHRSLSKIGKNAPWYGKKLSDEHKNKIRAALLNNSMSKKVAQFTIEGEFIKEYESASEASRQTGVSSQTICYACNKKQKTAGGFKWFFI